MFRYCMDDARRRWSLDGFFGAISPCRFGAIWRNSEFLIFYRSVLVEIIRVRKNNSRSFYFICRTHFAGLPKGFRMPSWQHAATFLAFVVIAAVVVFAGGHRNATSSLAAAGVLVVEK